MHTWRGRRKMADSEEKFREEEEEEEVEDSGSEEEEEEEDSASELGDPEGYVDGISDEGRLCSPIITIQEGVGALVIHRAT